MDQLMRGASRMPQAEIRMRRLDGTVMDLEVESTIVEFDGAPAVAVTGRDITARKEAERAAHANRALLDTIIDSTPSSIFALDRQHRLTLVNASMSDTCGMSKEELLGKALRDIFTPQVAAEMEAANARIMQTGESVSTEQIFERKKDGASRIVLSSKFPLRDESGAISGVAGVVTDVTAHRMSEAERTSLAAQLQQAQKMESVGRLAGGVAHDFNNMLGVILGHAELALMRLDPAQPLHADLLEIRQAAERSTDLTRQLLTFARQQIVAPRILDLNEAVDECATDAPATDRRGHHAWCGNRPRVCGRFGWTRPSSTRSS